MTIKTNSIALAVAICTVLALPGLAMAADSKPAIVRHANTPPGLILQGVTVPAGAKMLYLSGQLAAPIDPANKTPSAQMTTADFGDTKTQTISVFSKIKAILAAQGYAMSDIIKLTVFVAGDPKLGGKMDFAGMTTRSRCISGRRRTPTPSRDRPFRSQRWRGRRSWSRSRRRRRNNFERKWPRVRFRYQVLGPVGWLANGNPRLDRGQIGCVTN